MSDENPLSFLTDPFESKIPPELRDEIYAAEANTPAAQERGARVATYALTAFVGILLAFFNAFITELRSNPLPPEADPTADPLVLAGFDWVRSNPIFGFLFTNKIGGGICLLGGAGAGLMAEAELDTKKQNAEKIFEEMQRRRAQKEKKQQPKAVKKKKRKGGKVKKRMGALSEVVAAEPEPVQAAATAAPPEESKEEASEPEPEPANEKQGDGIMGKIKGFYDKADSMAASQALLLNKELEDRGVVDKITDETGLKIVGREEAAKLQEKQQKEGETK